MTTDLPITDAELKALLRAATELPWAIWRDLNPGGLITIGDQAGVIPDGELHTPTDAECNTVAHVYMEEDTQLILAAVNALPRLLADRQRLTAELAQAQDELRVLRDSESLSVVDAIRKRDQARTDRDQARAELKAARQERNDALLWVPFETQQKLRDQWRADRAPAQPTPGETEHPERHCGRCGGPNISWSAPSPLWNQVMRGGDIGGTERFDGIVCPTCFAILAEEAGVAELWRLYAERVHVPLETVTPSGRVWDEATWLWIQPGAEKARASVASDDTGPDQGGELAR